jgi:hypothetical protein
MNTQEEKELLLKYATTVHQQKVLKCWISEGSYRKAADKAGVDDSSLARIIKACRARAAKSERSQHNGTTQPDGYAIKGTSSLVDYRNNPDGDTILQWVKTDQDKVRQLEIMQEAVAALSEDIPRLAAIRAPKMDNKQLLNCYIVTDYHFGMLAWDEEVGAGENWDTEIAADLLIKWFEAAIASSPEAETGILCNLGDFMHFSGLEAITPESGHILDADTRFHKVVRIVIRTIRTVVDMLLHKHKKVHVIMAEGNHDRDASPWLSEFFSAMYEREKRVTVETSPSPYYCYEWGKTSLFFHHGHKKTVSNVADVFAAMFREVFGRTQFSYAHMGHRHHIDMKENNLMVVEQHRTLASKDAYASRLGLLSKREASCITYHKDYGQAGRVTITPDMVKS